MELMVILMVLALRAHNPKLLIKLLKEKFDIGILEPLSAPYLNWRFTVPKKNDNLHFITTCNPSSN